MHRSPLRILLATLAVPLLATGACGSGNGATGTEGSACFPDGTCFQPLVCLSAICTWVSDDVATDDSTGDAATDPGGSGRDAHADAAAADRPGGDDALEDTLDDATGDLAGDAPRDLAIDPDTERPADAPATDSPGPADVARDPGEDAAGDLPGADLHGPPDEGADSPTLDLVTPPDAGDDACIPIPYFYTACCGNDRCWYDSCGTAGERYQACDGTCIDDECQSSPGTGLTGAACEDGNDCVTGFCMTQAMLQNLMPALVLPGGMCSQVYCLANAECGEGASCVQGAGVYPTFPAICLQRCTRDTDCKRLDWSCADIGTVDVDDVPASGCMPLADIRILLCQTDRCATAPKHRLCPASCP